MDEQKVREAAYRLWEKQGKPHGQDLEHWFTAEKSAGEEDFDGRTNESTLSSGESGVGKGNLAPSGKRLRQKNGKI